MLLRGEFYYKEHIKPQCALITFNSPYWKACIRPISPRENARIKSMFREKFIEGRGRI